jgi:hypothetical protein
MFSALLLFQFLFFVDCPSVVLDVLLSRRNRHTCYSSGECRLAAGSTDDLLAAVPAMLVPGYLALLLDKVASV